MSGKHPQISSGTTKLSDFSWFLRYLFWYQVYKDDQAGLSQMLIFLSHWLMGAEVEVEKVKPTGPLILEWLVVLKWAILFVVLKWML
jgi:hypothetical protein